VSPDPKDQRAVIDRITDEWAVLLIGDHEQERRVKADELPDGAKEGLILKVRVSGLRVDVLSVDDAATEEKRSAMEDRLGRLKRTRSTGRFSKHDSGARSRER
jgi:hypothetical protein